MQKVKVKLFVLLFLVLLVSIGIAGERSFKAKLFGFEEVPKVTTHASGEAVFQLSKEGNELTYKLTVRNILNVTAAHIHEGKKGENGPPIAKLYTGPKKEHEFTGTLAKGTITAKDLMGPLKGKLFSHFIQMIEDGHAYVNVHSETHPDGEIRGKIWSDAKVK